VTKAKSTPPADDGTGDDLDGFIAEREQASYRQERDAARNERDRARRALADVSGRLAMYEEVDGMTIDPPSWLAPKTPRGKQARGIPNLLVSDTHFDEIVNPVEVEGANAYNREIAELRLKRLHDRTIILSRDYFTGLKFEGGVVYLGGDMFSGMIHEELKETNEAPLLASVVHWIEQLTAFVGGLADEFGHLHIPCVVGNHGRLTRKPRSKFRAQDNVDWLLYKLLAREFRTDDRVTFQVPDSADCDVDVYATRFKLTHGDQFRGGSGIAGIMSPLSLGQHRKTRREIGLARLRDEPIRGFDWLVMGHWHQYIVGRGLIVNGCFPAGSKVMTSTGYTPIEQIEVGETVMSSDGTEQKVSHVFEKDPAPTIGVKVKGLPEVVWATENHAIWAAKANSKLASVPPSRRHLISAPYSEPRWIPAGLLSPGDYVHVPHPQGDERPVDAETAWAYGLYIAEGNAILDGGSTRKHHRVHLTMHKNEREHVDRWATWFESTFGKTPIVGHRNGRNTTDLYCSAGRDVSVWFRETFGHTAHQKHLPDGALWWADDLKAALLDGWVLGDGHSHQNDDCRPTVSATTVSPQLAWGMFHIAPASGMWPTLSLLPAGGRRKSDTYTVHLNVGQDVEVIDGRAFYRISERFENPDAVPVYDLEVSGDHTYTVGGIGVHNSTKGYDEYAYTSNFEPEPPSQAFWIVTPEHGISFSAPVLVADRKKEQW